MKDAMILVSSDDAYEMLMGCMNRMCVTDQPEELTHVYVCAMSNLYNLYLVNHHKLCKKHGCSFTLGYVG